MQHFNCGNQGDKDYKFNVTSVWNYNNTTSSNDFTIVKDDVAIPSGAISNPTDINRESGTGRFVFRINDTDNASYVTNESTNAALYFGYDNAQAYNISHDANPNSTGYVNYDLNPDCNYSTGVHYWLAGSVDDACYEAVNLSTNPTFNVSGQLKNNLTLPEYDSNHNVTDLIPVNFTTLSDCSADRTDDNPVINATNTIELSLTGSSWESCSSSNSYEGWYNCTWNSTSKAEGQWDVRLNTTKPGYFYSNSTTYTDWFTLVNWNVSNISTPSVDPAQGGWTRLYNYTVNVSDQEGDSVNCSLFISRDNQTTWEY